MRLRAASFRESTAGRRFFKIGCTRSFMCSILCTGKEYWRYAGVHLLLDVFRRVPNCLADLKASRRAARARPLLKHASGVALVLDGAPTGLAPRHTADATFPTTGTHLIEDCPTQKQKNRYRLRPTLPLKFDCNLSESKIALCDVTYTKNKNICTKRRVPLLLELLLGWAKIGQPALHSVLAIWLLQHSRSSARTTICVEAPPRGVEANRRSKSVAPSEGPRWADRDPGFDRLTAVTGSSFIEGSMRCESRDCA